MKTPKKEDDYFSNEAEKKNGEAAEKDVNILTEDELDSIAGGVAPIIKPPT